MAEDFDSDRYVQEQLDALVAKYGNYSGVSLLTKLAYAIAKVARLRHGAAINWYSIVLEVLEHQASAQGVTLTYELKETSDDKTD